MHGTILDDHEGMKTRFMLFLSWKVMDGAIFVHQVWCHGVVVVDKKLQGSWKREITDPSCFKKGEEEEEIVRVDKEKVASSCFEH
jgi:hypothetical protein